MSNLRRRRFVQLAGIATTAGVLGSCGHSDSEWRFLTAAEGRTLEALCEQIIPTDETPGAAWAGAVNYMDRQLMGPFLRQRAAYHSGLAALDQAARHFDGKPFTELAPARQTALLSSLQGEPRASSAWSSLIPCRATTVTRAMEAIAMRSVGACSVFR